MFFRDLWMTDAHQSLQSLCLFERGSPKPCNIECCGILTSPTPSAVLTTQPGPPMYDLAQMLRGLVGIRCFCAAWAGVRGPPWLLPKQVDPGKETLVFEHLPQYAPNLRIIAPVAPLAFGVSSSSLRLHRL